MAAATGFLAAGEAGTGGLGLGAVGLVAGNAPPAATPGPRRAQPVEPAAGGRRLERDAGRRHGQRLGGRLGCGLARQHGGSDGHAEFPAWRRSTPAFKLLLSGPLWTAQGPRRVTALRDTGATHCFTCARLATALGLRPSGQPGPKSVSTEAAGAALGLVGPVLIHLSLGDTFRESLSVSPMDMDVGADLILGWDWFSSHDCNTSTLAARFVFGRGLLCCSMTFSRRTPTRRCARYR